MIGLSWGRTLAESRMTETVIIRRRSGTTEDSETLTETPVFETLYEGPARVKFSQNQPDEKSQASQLPVVSQPEVHLPVSASIVPSGAEITVTASSVDSLIVGRVFTVVGLPVGGQVTARRYMVQEVA